MKKITWNLSILISFLWILSRIYNPTIVYAQHACNSIVYSTTGANYSTNTPVTVWVDRSASTGCGGAPGFPNVFLQLDGANTGLTTTTNAPWEYYANISSGGAGTHSVRLTVNNNACACNTTTFCTVPNPPTGLSPSSGTYINGTYTVSWSAVAGATAYALRIDDLTNGWTGTCASVNPGDVCNNSIGGTTYNYTFLAGHSYQIWVHAMGCGGSAQSSISTLTIQGAVLPTALPTAPVPASCNDCRAPLNYYCVTGSAFVSNFCNSVASPFYSCTLCTAPTAVPPPTSVPCPIPGSPGGLSPQGSLTPGLRTFSWGGVGGASGYYFRMDDLNNGWTGTCATVNPGDICTAGTIGSTNYPNINLQAGHSYSWWVHSANSCGNYSAPTYGSITVPLPTPVPPTAVPAGCTVTTNPALMALQIGRTGVVSASISNPGAIPITRIDWTTSNAGSSTVSPTTGLGTTTVVTARALGSASIRAQVFLSNGNNCISAVANSTNVVSSSAPPPIPTSTPVGVPPTAPPPPPPTAIPPTATPRPTNTPTPTPTNTPTPTPTNTPTPTPTPTPKPWMKVYGGDVYQNHVNLGNPVPTQIAGTLFLNSLSGGGNTVGVVQSPNALPFGMNYLSVNQWYIQSADSGIFVFSSYWDALSSQSRNGTGTIGNIADLPGTNRIIRYNGNYTLDTGFATALGGQPIIYLLQGNLTINNNFNLGTNDVGAFFVNGNITIGPGVSQIAGMYVTSGTFNVAQETGAPLQLTINGMLLANGLNLNRVYGDITFPTYTVNYQPQYAVRMLPYLGRTQVSWQELAP